MSSHAPSSVSATSEPADAAVSLASASAPDIVSLRSAARKANGHPMDPAADGLVLLEQEHDSISHAMSVIIAKAEQWCNAGAQAIDAEATEIDTLVQQMVALIAQHASNEERHVYPLFATHLKESVKGISANMIYERNIADDDANKRFLDLLLQMKMNKDGQLMLATLKKLQVIEEEHLTQEEHWFALLRSQMSAPALSTLSSTLRSSATLAPTWPHSTVGPSHGLAARIVHPVVGVMDRAADKIIGRDTGLETREGGAKQIRALGHGGDESDEKRAPVPEHKAQ